MGLSEHHDGRLLVFTLDRPERRNALDASVLRDLDAALDRAEAEPTVRVLALRGRAGVFCTGADLGGGDSDEPPDAVARLYFRTLRRLTASPRLVVAVVDGTVQAGGVGLVAAADHAVCSEGSDFRLPELLLGLIPACVLPFLVRRMGVHAAQWLALTAQRLDAHRALELRLVDQVAQDLDDALRRLVVAAERLPAHAVAGLKRYVHQFAPIGEREEDLAVKQIASLLADPRSRRRVEELVRHGLWPEGGA